jgi:hypothetical protein
MTWYVKTGWFLDFHAFCSFSSACSFARELRAVDLGPGGWRPRMEKPHLTTKQPPIS